MKRCHDCKIIQPHEAFTKAKVSKDGYFTYCKTCNRARQKRYRDNNPEVYAQRTKVARQNRQRWFIQQRMAPCTDCGIQYHHSAMQFDHLPSFKKNIEIWEIIAKGWAKSRVLEELAKCELVCANCHALRTHRRRHESGQWKPLDKDKTD